MNEIAGIKEVDDDGIEIYREDHAQNTDPQQTMDVGHKFWSTQESQGTAKQIRKNAYKI